MSTYTRRIVVVVTADIITGAHIEAKKIDTVGGERTFTVGLSGTGSTPATHYWCSWQVTPAQYDQLTSLLASLAAQSKAWLYDGMTTTPEQVLAARGLKRVATPL